jgi:hypothetical protein
MIRWLLALAAMCSLLMGLAVARAVGPQLPAG